VSTAPPPPEGPHNAPVPILMYHVLAPPLPNDPYPDLYVKPADFRAQVAWLAAHGYHAVTRLRVDESDGVAGLAAKLERGA
jgi:hypothetical protein